MDEQPPPRNEALVYFAIAGTAALLCFAFLLTANIWLTLAIVALGFLHLLRFHPAADAYITSDPLLLWIRRYTPLIVLLIIGAEYLVTPVKH